MDKKGIMLKEGDNAKKLYPVTLTRAAFDINVGGFTLYNIIKEYFPDVSICFRVREEIEKITHERHANEKNDGLIVIDACAVPSIENMKKIEAMLNGKPQKLDLINFPHEIIIWHKKICKENIEFMANRKRYDRPEDGVCIGKNVLVHENVVLNTENGAVIIDDNARIMPFSYIAGPVYIGKNTKIADHASIKENTVILDVCKVGGEVEDSIIMSYSNKQHYGFLGNSLVGEWVNIGAGTTTSDLKNTYGTIAVADGNGEKIQTKEQFLGSVIGDYSKLAINTSVFTGKTVGVNSMIYGHVDKDVPSFVNFISVLKGKDEEFRVEKAIETQKRMFERRNVQQKKEDIELLKNVFETTKNEREGFFR